MAVSLLRLLWWFASRPAKPASGGGKFAVSENA